MLLHPRRYEFQMQYGSIGWSVGALLGYAQAATNKRVIACIGDGSFQVFFFSLSLSLFSLTEIEIDALLNEIQQMHR